MIRKTLFFIGLLCVARADLLIKDCEFGTISFNPVKVGTRIQDPSVLLGNAANYTVPANGVCQLKVPADSDVNIQNLLQTTVTVTYD